MLGISEHRLTGRDVLAGSSFTPADVVPASVFHLAFQLKLLEQHLRCVEYVKLPTARPVPRRAVAVQLPGLFCLRRERANFKAAARQLIDQVAKPGS